MKLLLETHQSTQSEIQTDFYNSKTETKYLSKWVNLEGLVVNNREWYTLYDKENKTKSNNDALWSTVGKETSTSQIRKTDEISIKETETTKHRMST